MQDERFLGNACMLVRLPTLHAPSDSMAAVNLQKSGSTRPARITRSSERALGDANVSGLACAAIGGWPEQQQARDPSRSFGQPSATNGGVFARFGLSYRLPPRN